MLKDRLILANIITNLLAIQAGFWLIFLNLKRLPPEIPLFYIFDDPAHILAPLDYYWLLPGAAAVIFALNLGLAKLLYRRDEVLAKILLGVSSVTSGLFCIETLQIFRRVLY